MDALSHLARLAREPDEAALGRLVNDTYEQVWRLCASLVDEASADDLAQESYLRAVRALPGYRGDASVRTWLLAIARRACMDDLRTRARRRRLDARPEVQSPAGRTAPDPADELVLADLLNRLEPERRAAFVATQVLGLSYEEAAEVCECPPGTIRSRVARARTELIGALGDRANRSRTRRDQSSIG